MKFNINDYKGKYVMHCKTQKELNNFIEYLKAHGYSDNVPYHNDKCYYGENVYYFNVNAWSSIDYAQKEGYIILEWSYFMGTFTKADLKTGDVILRRDGDVEIVIRLDKFELFLRDDGEYNTLYGINDDLTSTSAISRDIIAVRRPNNNHECVFNAFEYKRGTLVYEREETEEMTLAEVCKLLGKNIKIIQ